MNRLRALTTTPALKLHTRLLSSFRSAPVTFHYVHHGNHLDFVSHASFQHRFISSSSDSDSENMSVLYDQAKTLQLSQPGEAIDIYQKIIRIDQNSNDGTTATDAIVDMDKVRLNMGVCYARQEQHEEAVDSFHAALNDHGDAYDPSSTMTRFLRGMHSIGDDDSATATATVAVSADVDHKNHVGTCWNGIAMSLAAMGEYASASSAFEEALQQFGTDEYSEHAVTIMENLGTLNTMCGDEDKALKYFEDALKMHDSNHHEKTAMIVTGATLNFHVGKSHQIKSNPSQAIVYYNNTRDIIDESTTSSPSCNNGNHDSALMVVAAQTLYNLAVIYAEANELDNALAMHNDALVYKEKLFGEVHEEVAESLNCIGAIQGAKGDRGEALKAFRKALRVYRLADADEEHEDLVSVKRNIALIESSSIAH